MIERGLQFEVMVIFTIIVIIFTKILPVYYIIIIAFGGYMCQKYIKYANNDMERFNIRTSNMLKELMVYIIDYAEKKSIDSENFNKDKYIKKMSINNLYVDTTLVYFIYSIRELYKYSDINYMDLLYYTDKLLGILNEIEKYSPKIQENIFEMYESASDIRMKGVNTIHNFIYTVPKTKKMYKYVNKILERYMILTDRIMNKIRDVTNDKIKRDGVNTNTKFINHASIKGYDNLSMKSFL